MVHGSTTPLVPGVTDVVLRSLPDCTGSDNVVFSTYYAAMEIPQQADIGTATREARLTLAAAGGTYRMFVTGAEAVRLSLTADGLDDAMDPLIVRLAVEDIFGRPVRSTGLPDEVRLSADDCASGLELCLEPGVGYFLITAVASVGGNDMRASVDVGVVPPPHPGIRPDSFFSSNTAHLRQGEDLELLRRLGIKVQRVHFQPDSLTRGVPTMLGAPLSLDFAELDRAWDEAKTAEIWALPLAGYALPSGPSELASRMALHGPPRDFREFVSTWETILRRYPEITTWEFWNEPWLFSWTWAADGAAYRELQTMWCQMALAVNPDYRIVAGNSAMFTEDHIEPDPRCWLGLLDGTSHHPYTFSTSAPSLRAGDQIRSLDHGAVITRRMGLPRYYLTEGGTRYSAPRDPRVDAWDDNPYNNNANASKIVQCFVHAALSGAYVGNAQWNIGYGPGWTRSNTTLAVVAQLLEDRPIVTDIWPKNELLTGAIFASPGCVTPAVRNLPRAEELAARWEVKVPRDRALDRTAVAVVWATTGPAADALDQSGTLTIGDPTGLEALDMTGRPIPAGDTLVIPLSEHPVYIRTEALDVTELRERVAAARIDGITAVNLTALSLLQPAERPQTLQVRMQNQLNRDVSGELTMRVQGHDGEAVVPFSVAAGELCDVPLRWPGQASTVDNRHSISIAARGEGVHTRREQTITAARFARRTVVVDGTLTGWEGAAPVVLRSEQLAPRGVDPTEYLLNPAMIGPSAPSAVVPLTARVYTAYDDEYVYIAAAVDQERFSCPAGELSVKGLREPKVELPYRRGMPDGLDHIALCGDSFSFAFGFRDRVPGWGRQMDDPYAWKGQFYDTDYHYVAHGSVEGAQLVRQWGPDSTRRTAYQAEPVPGVGPVAGAQIAIERDESARLTVYELALPREELSLFDPSRGVCRFGFIFFTPDETGLNRSYEWSAAAGVFDYWRSAGSFGPSWRHSLACQTYFGIEADGAEQPVNT